MVRNNVGIDIFDKCHIALCPSDICGASSYRFYRLAQIVNIPTYALHTQGYYHLILVYQALENDDEESFKLIYVEKLCLVLQNLKWYIFFHVMLF